MSESQLTRNMEKCLSWLLVELRPVLSCNFNMVIICWGYVKTSRCSFFWHSHQINKFQEMLHDRLLTGSFQVKQFMVKFAFQKCAFSCDRDPEAKKLLNGTLDQRLKKVAEAEKSSIAFVCC